MSLTSIFDIAGSGMSAQNVRLNTVASNIANAESVSSNLESTYRARHPVFSVVDSETNIFDRTYGASAGVRVDGIVESEAPLRRQYEPDHPSADEEGYVYYPNVNIVEEMADMISASRSFQINVEIMNSAKQMMQRVMTLGQ